MPLPLPRIRPDRVAVSAWIVAIAAGFLAIQAHESTPGRAGAVPGSWPSGSPLPGASGRPEVVMAVHPKCSCSRASLAILGEVVGGSRSAARIRLLVYRPADTDACWSGDSLMQLASGIPGAEAVDDPGGAESRRFGLLTSGAVAAFDATGNLRFAGGLNDGRASTSSAAGAKSLADVLAGLVPETSDGDVFGCPIDNPGVAP